MHTKHSGYFAVVLSVSCIFLTACEDSKPVLLPEGVQTVTGTLIPVDLSLVRRGSHVIRVNGKDLYYVESKLRSLAPFAGRIVTLHGTVEHNVEAKDLPVLVVQEVEGSLEDTLIPWKVPSLRLSLSAPDAWIGRVDGASLSFTSGMSGSAVLRLYVEQLGGVTFADFVQDKTGIPLVVSQKRALRLQDEVTGSQTVYVDRGVSVLRLDFTPSSLDALPSENAAFLALLKSLSFQADSLPSSASQSGSGAGMPCGGPAGILCPAQHYCDITDAAASIGKCVAY